jgi:hypothetical protein
MNDEKDNNVHSFTVNHTNQDKKDIERLNFDHDLENGPIKNRKCTDIFFSILFIVFLLAMLVVASVGWHQGDP